MKHVDTRRKDQILTMVTTHSLFWNSPVLNMDYSINIVQTHVWGNPEQASYGKLMLVFVAKIFISVQVQKKSSNYYNMHEHQTWSIANLTCI